MTTTYQKLIPLLSGTVAIVEMAAASPGDITTVAGSGTPGYIGNDGPATSARISNPYAIASDAEGNFYFSDYFKQIRRVDGSTGIITHHAGIFNGGNLGDEGPATDAGFKQVYGLAVDPEGNLIISDTHNHRIRRVDSTTGIVTTIAGNGSVGYSGDGGPATQASLKSPHDIAVDQSGHIYVCDTYNHRVRKIDANTGFISTIAGTGSINPNGAGHPAIETNFDEPRGLCIDPEGNVYLSDTGHSRIYRIDAVTGIVGIVAGTGSSGYNGDDIPATSAMLNSAKGIDVDAEGNLYIAEYSGHRIRRIDAATGLISTVAGTGAGGFNGDNIPGAAAKLYSPHDVAVDPAGNVLVCDSVNARIRQLESAAAPGVIPATPPSLPASFQPDVTIGSKVSGQSGNNVYNHSGSGQTLNLRLKGRRKGTFFFCAESDSTSSSSDTQVFRATKGTRDLKAKYTLVGGGNVTASIIRGELSLNMPPGGKSTFKTSISPKLKGGSKKRKFTISTSSSRSPGRADVVMAKVKASK